MTEESKNLSPQPEDLAPNDEVTGPLGGEDIFQEELPYTQTILDKLPADFRDGAISNHNAMRDVVSHYIKAGKLSENYRLPELNELADRVAILMPIFDVMQQKGWKPEVVLVPKGLSLDTWNTLLTGHRLPDGKLSEGLAYPENILDNPEPVSDETDRWEVVVISAGSRPPIREVRPDGANDKYTQKMNALIADLLDKTKSSSLPTVRRFSPSREAYLALQLTQFARHKPPVDAIYGGSQTIAKELHEELYAWRLGWDEFSNRITCNFYRIDATTEDVGLRPTIMEQELELKLI